MMTTYEMRKQVQEAAEAEMIIEARQAQHQATWAMAISAAVKKLEWCNFNGKGLCDATPRKHVADMPCPPLETKGE